MKMRRSRWWIVSIAVVLLIAGASRLQAQDKATDKPAAPAKPAAAAEKAPAPAVPAAEKAPAPAAKQAAAPVAEKSPSDKPPVAPPAPSGRFRKLAPGVMKGPDVVINPSETVSRHDIVELLAVDPSYDFAKNVMFTNPVWTVEFAFKPMRLITVDVPQPSGQVQRKTIWYMVYCVTNRGHGFKPVAIADGTDRDGSYRLEPIKDLTVQFVPSFTLEAVGLDKEYPDRSQALPTAMAAIRKREDPNRVFANTADVARDLKPGDAVWGVAMWEDVDPRINKFCVYVTGLTNSYQWSDAPGKFQKGSPLGTGRQLVQKALKLNFRRIGDEMELKESQIRYGIPEGVDYEWVAR
jgi:hypothetical protein